MYVKHVSFAYPKADTNVLTDIHFELQPHKINVLAGLNGAGKTTLFDCMTGILKVSSGQLELPSISEILYLTQTIFFSSTIKGKDFVKFIAELSNKRASHNAIDYTEQMDERERELFVKLWNSKIGMMSVGEKKWLFVTMLTQVERKLYIFDEPTSGVDPSSRMKIMNRIQRLLEQNKWCIVSTHQLQELLHLDCHFIMLHNGKVAYEGDFKQWLNWHQTDNPDIAFERTVSTS
ncbi:ATP-binding cassette domain-containing protein [Paenibacillus sp. 481]|uniref:ATP-binding cassette domain-containing protein n=1 Tax=Paenibacillus sp. 481 TaxID=2835869 RepID=UPI001E3EE373|nr:ABC transporter ATP-binding protein [Paenibacillus sp. 481]UHA74281.1 ABC transporter ATP-binding protein [Paenibacillus sp. 481]